MPAPKRPLGIPRHAGFIAKMFFGFVVLILMGYFALVALNPRARQWATSRQGPTPFKFLNQLLAIPAQAVGKTKDVVAASDARVGVLDKVIAEEEGKKAKPGPDTAARESVQSMQEKVARLPDTPDTATVSAPAKPPNDPTKPYAFTAAPAVAAQSREPAPPTQMKLPGGIVITSASPAGAPAASANFLYWVVNLNISGVFQNNPPRILLDKRLVYEGQEVSAVLGVVFDHLEVEKKLIVFRDKTGALVTRSY